MKAKTISHGNQGLQRFLAAHGADVTGVIGGYDWIRQSGSLRYLYQSSFMFSDLCEAGARMKEFARYVGGLTNWVCAASAAFAAKQSRPMRCFESCADSKVRRSCHKLQILTPSRRPVPSATNLYVFRKHQVLGFIDEIDQRR